MTNNNGENETRQFGRVTGDNETRQFGAPQHGGNNQQPRQQSPQRPQQYFPEPGSQSASGYGQSYQQQYEPVPSSYHVEEPKKGSGALAYVFAAIAAIAVVIAGVLFFLWRGAAEDANKPAPEPVTHTQTVTTEVPTTVTTTEDAPLDEFPTDLPTDLPPDLQDQLDQGGSELEDLLNDLFGELETNSGADNV